MDKPAVLARVAALAADLEPFENVDPEEWELAVAAIVSAVTSGQAEPIAKAGTESARHPRAEERLSRLEPAVEAATQEPPAQTFLVCRRGLSAIGGMPGGLPDWAVGRLPDRTFGPFRDTTGRTVFIDRFPIIQNNFKLVRSAGAAPFLVLPIRALIPIGDQFALGNGSVWFISSQLASDAPPGGYTGLKIQSGTVSFTQSIEPSSGLEIVVPGNVDCTIALQLDPGATPPTGSGAGQDARDSVVQTPETVTVLFTSTGATIQALGSGHVEVYGSASDLQDRTTPAQYLDLIRRIIVPMNASAAQFTMASVRSSVFQPAGTAPILVGGWALPVAVVSPDSLGDAAGAGGLALVLLAGITATWEGQPSATSLGTSLVLVEPGQIVLVTNNSRGLGARQTIQLWGKTPDDPPSSRIELFWTGQFTVQFAATTAGVETLVLPADMTANLDRPITAAGHRLPVHAGQAQVTFLESPAGSGVFIDASLDTAPSPQQDVAFAIDNALFRLKAASSFRFTGEDFDGVRARRGVAQIGFSLQFLLPTLPDPYAANFPLPAPPFGDPAATTPFAAVIAWSAANPPFLNFLMPAPSAPQPMPPIPAAPEIPVVPDMTLLDLSTNLDQFGVAVKTPASGTIAPGPPLAVDGMHLVCPGNTISILTLPAVLWEPVFTEDSSGFPSPLTFDQHGGPTTVTVQSGAFVRVAPEPALDNLVSNFASADPQPAAADLTLPFGIKAFASLTKPSPGAAVNYNRPDFSSECVQGGHQISLRAIEPGPGSPGFTGSAVQLKIARSGGVPVNKSVLDDKVDTIFNNYLGPQGSRPLVPVTRLDLSGYGESLFSDWRNPTDDPLAVSQARFDVLLGRAAYEVVQVRSILYPYGVRVVREITIFRKNSGAVVREDSGWQAATDGEYSFPDNNLVTHPGVVLRILNVRNIRDTGQFLNAGGIEMAGVRFDGELEMENVVSGPPFVPARDQIGYVQMTPASSGNLNFDQYAALVGAAGPMGGPIDCVIDIGGSGQLMKLGRVGVGVTPTPGPLEFVMTAWGSPRFAQGGQWSFLRQSGAGTAPELIDKDRGIPLIRVGPAGAQIPSAPYRFADPEDLARPDSPASDYGIVHATGTQRVFFPRPQISPATPGRITSTLPPILADPYALATSVGFFPRTDAAIPFPDNNYALAISGGNYRLEMPSPSFPVTVGQRTLSDTASARTFVDYSGSTVELAIDTSVPLPWSFRLSGVAVATSTPAQNELMRIRGDIEADANTNTRVARSEVIFGPSFQPVQDLFPFMKGLPLPTPLSVLMTNSTQLKLGLKIPLDDALNASMPVDRLRFVDTDVTVSLTVIDPAGTLEFELNGTIFVATVIVGLAGVGLFDLDVRVSSEFGIAIGGKFGAGVGTFFLAEGFEVFAYLVETFFIIVGDVISIGGALLLKGGIDLKVVELDLSVEAKVALIRLDSSSLNKCADTTVWAVAQVTFAIDVTIAWVFDIDIEFQAEWDTNMNGGPCELPDVL